MSGLSLVVPQLPGEESAAALAAAGVSLFLPDALPDEELDAVVCGRGQAARYLHCPRLRWMQLTSAGYDGVDLDAFRRRGIPLTGARGVYSVPIAEDVALKILLLARGYLRLLREGGGWSENSGQLELSGKTLLLLGGGSIGQEIAARLRPFGMRLLCYDPAAPENPLFDRVESRPEAMDALLGEADFVVLSLPLTPETHHLMDYRRFRAMKPTAYLVNIARGAVVNTPDLLRALEEGLLSGGALDVLEQEPPDPDDPVLREPRLLITPHQAWAGDGNARRIEALWTENALRLAAGKRLLNCIV